MGMNKADINPFITAETPFLDQLLGEHCFLIEKSARTGFNYSLHSTKADLGVAGIPQSATGQTTLFTGKNAALALGHHLRGFPDRALRSIIKEENIYKKLLQLQCNAAFANVYRPEFFTKYSHQEKYHSVTTTAAISAGIKIRTVTDLFNEKGIFQDITNTTLKNDYGIDVPIIDPLKAGENLANLSKHYFLTVFEYFKTDLAGHKQNYVEIQNILSKLDSFIEGIVKNVDLSETVIIITSDHGNIEDISHKNHTENQVPTLVITEIDQALVHSISTIEDITPFILKIAYKRRKKHEITGDLPFNY